MFSKEIVCSDTFLDMPPSTQLLYFQFGMEADDDGFLGSPNKLIRAFGANKDEMTILQAKGFIIPFNSGVVVIRHWRENNQIRADRYKETVFLSEKSQLKQDKNGWYELGIPNGNQMATIGKPSIGKGSIGKGSIGKISAPQADAVPFDLETKLEDMEKKPGSHLDVIASFIREKKLKPQSSAELTALIKRHARMATQLTAFMEPTDYPMRRVFKAMEKCSDESKRLNYDWSLETVLKKLTQ